MGNSDRLSLPDDEADGGKDGTQQKGVEKKRYEKPQIVYRAPLEAMAAVCAPSPPAKSNPGACPSGPISS
jgi:hypothetical protein